METLQNLLCVCFAILFCLCGLYVAEKTNLRKNIRGQQFLTIPFSIIFTVFAVVSYDSYVSFYQRLIDRDVSRLKHYASMHTASADTYNSLASTIQKTDWNICLMILANLTILLLFYAFKKLFMPLFKKALENREIYEAACGRLYEWNESLSLYALKSNLYTAKRLMMVYYSASCVIASSFLLGAIFNKTSPAYMATMYPFAIVAIMGEICFFFNGKTESEFDDNITGEDGYSSRHALYYTFSKRLQLLFGDRLIFGRVAFPNYRKNNNTNVLKRLEALDTQEAILANRYFHKKATTRLKVDADSEDIKSSIELQNDKDIKGLSLDEALVTASYRLMVGESVVFATPFYKDYSDYVFLPLNRTLTQGNKVMVILGRSGIEDDIKEWLNSSFENVANVPELWKVGYLSSTKPFDGDVAIVSCANVFDPSIVKNNADFIKDVTHVVLIEPSQFISTAQVSISVFVSNLSENVTYCVFDKNSDGLVDTLSHILKKSLASVTPTNKERNINTYMLWEAEGPSLSHRLFPSVARYLGVGTEIMTAALKEQVKACEWCSYSKFPVDEMKWISQQYFDAICDYACLPHDKEELEDRMQFNHNPWDVSKEEYKFVVVEDEFCNMFEIARQFASRGTKEAFVNIISENYMLRDYMKENASLFENDPKAIPNFTADFVRTERNIVLELLLRLHTSSLSQDEIVKLLRHLCKDESFDEANSYSIREAVYNLVTKYVPKLENVSKDSFLDVDNMLYSLKERKQDFEGDSIFNIISELKSVYYILEDENEKSNYLDAKLYGQVYQAHIPGQHIVIGGMNYEILYVGADKGVLLKRASDHINGREYYRQIRTYTIDSFTPNEKIGSQTTIGDIVITSGKTDFSVNTSGYLSMANYGDFSNGCIKKAVNAIPTRSYKGKECFKITMPNISQQERVTLVILLNEIFKTLYADNASYICALTSLPEGVPDGMLYGLCGDGVEDDSIYVVEDSVLDMGLISSVLRNIGRIFEIITDYLEWYNEEQSIGANEEDESNLDSVISAKEISDIIASHRIKEEKKSALSKLVGELFKKKTVEADSEQGGE